MVEWCLPGPNLKPASTALARCAEDVQQAAIHKQNQVARDSQASKAHTADLMLQRPVRLWWYLSSASLLYFGGPGVTNEPRSGVKVSVTAPVRHVIPPMLGKQSLFRKEVLRCLLFLRFDCSQSGVLSSQSASLFFHRFNQTFAIAMSIAGHNLDCR